jgi:hypothetical protein
LAITLAFLVLAWFAFQYWDDFNTRAHGIAAVGMFAFLAAAVALNAWVIRSDDGKRAYFWSYTAIAGMMVALPIVLFPFDFEHAVLVIEAAEIVLVGVFWLLQTKEYWYETAAPGQPT